MVVKTEILTQKEDLEVKRVILKMLNSLRKQIQAIDYQGEIFSSEGDMLLQSACIFISDKVVDPSSVILSTGPLAAFLYQQMRDANLNTPRSLEHKMGFGMLLSLPDIKVSAIFNKEREDKIVDFIGSNLTHLAVLPQSLFEYTGRNSEQRWQGLGNRENLRASYRRNYTQEDFIVMPYSHIVSALRTMNRYMRPE